MDQIKTGKFIAQRRKDLGLTQMQLAEKLNITDRAISKWETGRATPDSSIMIELCSILKISVNDLLCGEIVTKESYENEIENNLLDMVKQKEESDKRLLLMELVLGICCLLPLVFSIIIVLALEMEEWVATLITLGSLIPLLIAMPFAIKIEQKAGYYECKNCGHRHIPKYSSVFLSMHVNRTRYIKCPKCEKRSWHKKVISNNEDE